MKKLRVKEYEVVSLKIIVFNHYKEYQIFLKMQQTDFKEQPKSNISNRKPTKKRSSSSIIGNVFDAPVNSKSDLSMNDSSTNRNRGSVESDQSINMPLDNGVRCHQVLEWDDPLEDRPITFRIRDF